jgi:hypothetical protein
LQEEYNDRRDSRRDSRCDSRLEVGEQSSWLPDPNEQMAGMAMVLFTMLEAPPDANPQVDAGLDPFNPRKVQAPAPHSRSEMYQFLEACYAIGQWTQECNIIAMVLAARFRTSSGVSLNRNNWPMVMLMALYLAQKSWDDVPLTNKDFAQLLEMASEETYYFSGYECSWQEANHMEMAFLEALDWNVHVTSRTFLTFHYELRDAVRAATGSSPRHAAKRD